MKYLNNLDLSKNELQNARIQNLASAPSGPTTGQIYYDTVLGYLRIWDGSTWHVLNDTWCGPVSVTSPILNSGTSTSPNISIQASGASANGYMSSADYNILHNATDANTVSTIVKRDSSGNFSAGTITATGLTGLGAPSSASDAATKSYVDAAINGLTWKPECRAATTANTATSGLLTIDGITLSAGDRVLVKNQTTGSQNGIYVAASGAWARATDFAAGTVSEGDATFVSEGTTNGGTAWVVSTTGTITVGTTSIAWTQFAQGITYTQGTGITISGTTISISASYVGQTSINTLGTITTGVWNGTTIDVAHGGTGSTTAAGARTNLGAAGKYSALVGDGSSTSIAITQGTHGLAADGTLHVQLFDASTGLMAFTDTTINNANGTVTLVFAVAPASNAYRVVIHG